MNEEEYDIDKAWSDFCIDGEINNFNENNIIENDILFSIGFTI